MPNENDYKGPREKLAAYVDGELEPGDHTAVEYWLVRDPEARADVEAQRHLARAWQATRPNEPDAGAWKAALGSIDARLRLAGTAYRQRRFPLRWIVGVAAAVLAAIALFVANRPTPPSREITVEPGDHETPFVLASANDIEITNFADAGSDETDEILLVGLAPVHEPMRLAGEGEIQLDEMTPERGMNPRFRDDPGMPPMIVPEADPKQP